MQPIPTPRVIDPDRSLGHDHGEPEARAALLDEALRESCSYAQQLWDHLDAARRYLYDSLPSDPHSPGPHPPPGGVGPRSPDDEDDWTNWIGAYASINSVLCGPLGDSGYGLSEARQLAQQRRTAPGLPLVADPAAAARQPDTASQPAQGEPPDRAAGRPAPRIARVAVTVILLALAARGLRRSPKPSTPGATV